MKMNNKVLLAGAALLVLAGCQHVTPLGADFGNAVNHNQALHVIDPQPATAGAGAPELNGERAKAAYNLYVRDRVEGASAESTD